jgi:hypothetical protein
VAKSLRNTPPSIADSTVSDGAQLMGHYAVHSNINLGPVRLSGILHESTLLMANSTVSAGCKESDEVEFRKPEDTTTEGNTSTERADIKTQI